MTNKTFDIAIQNYQIIENACMSFEQGLNVIVGDSNNGKTAVMRAIETAVFNLPRIGHVKNGKDFASVAMTYNGHCIKWERNTTSASQVSYEVDGEKITKVGRNQLPQVADMFGIKEVDLDTSKVRLNFQKQMAFPFLLDKTASQMFKFIVQGSEQDRLMEVIDDMKKDIAQNKTESQQKEASRDTIGIALAREKEKLESIIVYKDVIDDVVQYESDVNKYETLLSLIRSMDIVDCDIQNITPELDTLKRKCENVSLDGVDNTLKDIETLSMLVHDFQSCIDSGMMLKNRLSSVLAIVDTVNLLNVDSEIQNIADLQLAIKELSDIQAVGVGMTQRCNGINNELLSVENDLKDFKVCPYCGSVRE